MRSTICTIILHTSTGTGRHKAHDIVAPNLDVLFIDPVYLYVEIS